MSELDQSGQVGGMEPPHSIAQASIDDKGRLKLPVEFAEFLERSGVTKVFATTVDFRTVRLYPLSLWKHNENLFDEAGEDSQAGERLARIARAFGADVDIKDGRVLLPATLRQEMGLEKQAVVVDHHKGRINVVSKKIHDELLQIARASLADDLRTFEKRGFK